ncbi:F-box-like protein [Candidatus Rubidus massiliensis]|nr:F-box-like protein [Candidatus Rubidus massiliensis]
MENINIANYNDYYYLPNEITYHIFSYIPQITTLMRCFLVNKSWSQITTTIFKDRFKIIKLNDRNSIDLFNKTHSLVLLYLIGANCKNVEAASKELNLHEDIKFDGLDPFFWVKGSSDTMRNNIQQLLASFLPTELKDPEDCKIDQPYKIFVYLKTRHIKSDPGEAFKSLRARKIKEFIERMSLTFLKQVNEDIKPLPSQLLHHLIAFATFLHFYGPIDKNKMSQYGRLTKNDENEIVKRFTIDLAKTKSKGNDDHLKKLKDYLLTNIEESFFEQTFQTSLHFKEILHHPLLKIGSYITHPIFTQSIQSSDAHTTRKEFVELLFNKLFIYFLQPGIMDRVLHNFLKEFIYETKDGYCFYDQTVFSMLFCMFNLATLCKSKNRFATLDEEWQKQKK